MRILSAFLPSAGRLAPTSRPLRNIVLGALISAAALAFQPTVAAAHHGWELGAAGVTESQPRYLHTVVDEMRVEELGEINGDAYQVVLDTAEKADALMRLPSVKEDPARFVNDVIMAEGNNVAFSINSEAFLVMAQAIGAVPDETVARDAFNQVKAVMTTPIDQLDIIEQARQETMLAAAEEAFTAARPGASEFLGTTVVTDEGGIKFTLPALPIGEAIAQLPLELASKYDLILSEDGLTLSVNPKLSEPEPEVGVSRGFSVTDNELGGKNIQLEGGAFKLGEWKQLSFRDLITDQAKLARLEHKGYDVDHKRDILLVAGERDTKPTVFALSRNENKPGLVAVCSDVYFFEMDGSGSPMVLVRKPVVYLYPEQRTEVTVRVQIEGEFVAQYPKADDGTWRVIALPDGTLLDTRTERRYTYLFWEGTGMRFSLDDRRAHCVASHEAEAFLEHAAACYALNDRERTDFVSYWLPHLEKNPYSVVELLEDETYERYAKMDVQPRPDTTIRLFMVFRRSDKWIPTGNAMPTRIRRGFTVVEWGGCNLDERV